MFNKEFGKVAVLYGGWSSEREVSVRSGQAVLASLLKHGIDAVGVDVKEPTEVIGALEKVSPDCVFIALHGRGGEDGAVQGLLEMMKIPYTGSGILGTALSMDKLASKCIWRDKQMPTPKFLDLGEEFNPENVVQVVGLPLAVKPVAEGSSMGISRVDKLEELMPAWEKARAYGESVFAESWIEGEEYSVAFVGDRVFPPILLKYRESFYDFAAKYSHNETQYCCPAPLTLCETAKLQTLVWHATQVLHVHGWGRVDLRRSSDKKFWLLEVNTVPGMTDHSLVPIAAQEEDCGFDELTLKILATSHNMESYRDVDYI